jgi:hypothetical protein
MLAGEETEYGQRHNTPKIGGGMSQSILLRSTRTWVSKPVQRGKDELESKWRQPKHSAGRASPVADLQHSTLKVR